MSRLVGHARRRLDVRHVDLALDQRWAVQLDSGEVEAAGGIQLCDDAAPDHQRLQGGAAGDGDRLQVGAVEEGFVQLRAAVKLQLR